MHTLYLADEKREQRDSRYMCITLTSSGFGGGGLNLVQRWQGKGGLTGVPADSTSCLRDRVIASVAL